MLGSIRHVLTITVVAFVSMLAVPQALANDLLLALHGSNTIGAKLAPALVQDWLGARGYTQIALRETASQEVSIVATSPEGRPVRVDIEAHGSGTAFKGLQAGAAHVGMASRPIKGKERRALGSLGDQLATQGEVVVGLDGLAVIVNRDNAIDALDVDTLRRIFSGEIRNWSELGGPNARINVYARDDKSGTYDTFKSLVLRKSPLVPGAKRYESNADLSDDVSRDAFGIGFCGLPYVRESKALAVNEADTNSIAPAAFAVATEDYALSRRLFLYLPPASGLASAKDFIEFAASERGQEIVDDIGFVSQGIVEGDIVLNDSYPGEYVQLTRDAKRLSLNFRFAQGSMKLDTKAQRDLQRLVDYAKRPGNERRRIMLFGFADSNETLPIHALDLSINRADALAEALINAGVAPTRVRGYGQEVPVASNATEKGRIKNRRVEVWIR
jgi:phosphate transport system substrate-binding protein